jgi:hypothetical protein
MQLRVARLCLDCEEVFVGEICPICASAQSAYLTNWLHVDERRRWRRPGAPQATAAERRLTAIRQFFSNVFGDGSPVKTPGPPRTRRSDDMPSFDFDDKPKGTETTRPATHPHPAKSDAR